MLIIFLIWYFSATWGWFIGITDCAVNTEWKYYDTDISADVLDFGPNEGSDSSVLRCYV